MNATLPAALLAAVLAAVPGISRAEDVTPAQAAAVEEGLRGWFQGLVSPYVTVARSPVQVQPAGDRYRLIRTGINGEAGIFWPDLSLDAWPGKDGMWLLERRSDLPGAIVRIVGAERPAQDATPSAAPCKYLLNYAGSEAAGTFDPLFKRPSDGSVTLHGVAVSSTDDLGQRLGTAASAKAALSLRPADDDHVDTSFSLALQGFSTGTTPMPTPGVTRAEAPAGQLSAGRILLESTVAGLSRNRIAAIVRGAAEASALATAPDADARMAYTSGEAIGRRLVLDLMRSLSNGVDARLTLDDLSSEVTTAAFSAAQLRIGLQARAEGGLVNFALDAGLDKLRLPRPPVQGLTPLLPHKVVLRYVVSRVPIRLLNAFLEGAGQGPDAGRDARLGMEALRSGMRTGFESFALDIGGASVSGSAVMDNLDPAIQSGTAHLKATGLDQLMTQLQADPALARAVPTLIYLKGLGRAEDDGLAWDVAYSPGKVLVNGRDVARDAGK